MLFSGVFWVADPFRRPSLLLESRVVGRADARVKQEGSRGLSQGWGCCWSPRQGPAWVLAVWNTLLFNFWAGQNNHIDLIK